MSNENERKIEQGVPEMAIGTFGIALGAGVFVAGEVYEGSLPTITLRKEEGGDYTFDIKNTGEPPIVYFAQKLAEAGQIDQERIVDCAEDLIYQHINNSNLLPASCKPVSENYTVTSHNSYSWSESVSISLAIVAFVIFLRGALKGRNNGPLAAVQNPEKQPDPDNLPDYDDGWWDWSPDPGGVEVKTSKPASKPLSAYGVRPIVVPPNNKDDWVFPAYFPFTPPREEPFLPDEQPLRTKN